MLNMYLKLIAVPMLLTFSSVASAFDCPAKIGAAQAAIDKVTADMKGMEKMMDATDKALVHALVDDAKMVLAGAAHNHEKPQNAYDHARSMAKADQARGLAEAADVLHMRYMKK